MTPADDTSHSSSSNGQGAAAPEAAPRVDSAEKAHHHRPAWIPPRLAEKTMRAVEARLRRLARRNLILLAARGNIAETLSDVPEQMHKVARQTKLVIEFVDDFRSGEYREMPWWAVAVAVTAMLYTVNPADAIPNVIPIIGTLDDLAVVAVATRLLRGELERYCRFKGYAVEEYF